MTHVLSEFFELREDGFHNARADKEIQQYQAQASTNRRIARERIVVRSVDEASTKGTPNQEPLTKNQEPVVNLKPKERKKKERKAEATPFPKSFEISERVKAWAIEKGFTRLPDYFEFFEGRMKANGKTYEDWDQALMNCIREDWPKLRGNGGNGATHPQSDPPCSKCGGSTGVGFIHTSDGRVCSRCRASS